MICSATVLTSVQDPGEGRECGKPIIAECCECESPLCEDHLWICPNCAGYVCSLDFKPEHHQCAGKE